MNKNDNSGCQVLSGDLILRIVHAHEGQSQMISVMDDEEVKPKLVSKEPT